MLLSQYDKARVDEAMRANSIGIVEPATVPGISSKPNIRLNIALGALVGLMGGIGLAFLFENLDPTVRSTEDLETVARVRLLGRIPMWRGRRRFRHKAGSVEDDAVQTSVGEAFRVLSTNLLAITTEERMKTVLIASAVPGAGKTMVITKLAAAIAQAGRQVLVVDGDLRNPNVHKAFDLAQRPGLSDVLLHPNHLGSAVQDTEVRGVRVLASGSKRTNPAAVLSELAMSDVFRKLAAQADIVLVDSPPILASC